MLFYQFDSNEYIMILIWRFSTVILVTALRILFFIIVWFDLFGGKICWKEGFAVYLSEIYTRIYYLFPYASFDFDHSVHFISVLVGSTLVLTAPVLMTSIASSPDTQQDLPQTQITRWVSCYLSYHIFLSFTGNYGDYVFSWTSQKSFSCFIIEFCLSVFHFFSHPKLNTFDLTINFI